MEIPYRKQISGGLDEMIIGPATGELPFGMGDPINVNDPNVAYQPDPNAYAMGLGAFPGMGTTLGLEARGAGSNAAYASGVMQTRQNPATQANYRFEDPYRMQFDQALLSGNENIGQGQQTMNAQAAEQMQLGRGNLGQQQTNLAYLNQVQRGQAGPSLAELQMQQGTEDAIVAQRAASLGTPGWNPAAQAQAARAGQQMQVQNVRDTSQLRAQEQMQARDAYLGALGQYGQGVSGLGAMGQGYGQIDQGYGQLGQAQANLAMSQQDMQSQNAEFNAQQALELQRMNDAAALGYGDLSRQWYETGMRPLEFESEQAARRQELMAGQASDLNANRTNLAIAQSEIDAKQKGGMMGAAGAGIGVLAGIVSDRTMKRDVDAERGERANRDFQEALAAAYSDGAAGNPLPKSDPSEYRPQQYDREPELTPGQSAAAEALAEADPYAFKYTPEATARYGVRTAPQSQRYGIMAQDLAKTPAGATAVSRGPDGKLQIDAGQLAVLDAAATGDHERRLREMERQWKPDRAQMVSPQAFSASRYGRGY